MEKINLKKFAKPLLLLFAVAVIVGIATRVQAATNTYTFTIVCNNATFMDFRGNRYKTEPITFTVQIPTLDGTMPSLQKSGSFWSASGWNGNGNSFYSTTQANAYGFNYSSSLGNDYLGITNLDVNVALTTIPLWDYTTNIGYWNGNTYSSMVAMQDAFTSEIKQQQAEISMKNYPSPEVTTIRERGEKNVAFSLAEPSVVPSSISGKFYVNYETPDGILHTNEEIIIESVPDDWYVEQTPVAVAELSIYADVWNSGIVVFYYSAFADYIREYRQIETFTIRTIKAELQYHFSGDMVSKKSVYSYDYVTGQVSGNRFEVGGIDVPISNENTDLIINNQGGLVISTSNESSLQSIIDWFTSSLNMVTTSITRVFNSVVNLVTSAMSFISYIGQIYQAVLGSMLGPILTMGLLTAIILRLFAR